MKLKEIRLKNFRCYEDLTVPLDEKLTVLVAPNGEGKTTILHAAIILLEPYIHELRQGFGQRLYIDPSNIRLIPDTRLKHTSYVPMIAQTPCVLSTKSTDGREWYLSLESLEQKGIDNVESNKDIQSLLEMARKIVNNNKSVLAPIEQLPLFVFYGVNRGLGRTDNFWPNKDRSPIENTRFFAYHDCLIDASSYDNAYNWFINLYDKMKSEAFERLELGETISLNNISSDFTLAIQEVVDIVLKKMNWGRIKSQTQHYPRQSTIVLTHDEIGSLSLWQMSEGIRSVIGMVMDIAYRCCILNSHLGKEAVKKTEGVVLIDEIDMHLHPEWQQVILRDLQVAFPSLQFIVTTHSPQVLTTVPAECIRMINGQKIDFAPAGTKGAEASRILERIFLVESRPPQDENTQMLAEYRQLVYEDKWAENRAKELRQKLDTIFQGNEPELTALDLYIDNREWELSLEENQ